MMSNKMDKTQGWLEFGYNFAKYYPFIFEVYRGKFFSSKKDKWVNILEGAYLFRDAKQREEELSELRKKKEQELTKFNIDIDIDEATLNKIPPPDQDQNINWNNQKNDNDLEI
jgi:hypothetical protein